MPQSSEPTYYSLLGLHPSASAIEVRRAYRELSKRYHPDTTNLPTTVATAKFQQLNEAYATLSNPERRFSYDLKIGYSRFGVIQAPPDLNHPVSYSSAYLEATDRPLSPGEIFALFILGLTFLACLLLVITIGLTRGDAAFQTQLLQPTPTVQQHGFQHGNNQKPLRVDGRRLANASLTPVANAIPKIRNPVSLRNRVSGTSRASQESLTEQYWSSMDKPPLLSIGSPRTNN